MLAKLGDAALLGAFAAAVLGLDLGRDGTNSSNAAGYTGGTAQEPAVAPPTMQQ